MEIGQWTLLAHQISSDSEKQFPSYCGWKLGQILGGLVFLKFDSESKEVIYLTNKQWLTSTYTLEAGEKRATQPNLVNKKPLRRINLQTSFVDEDEGEDTQYPISLNFKHLDENKEEEDSRSN